MAKFCSECGKALEKDEMFCTKCGAKVGSDNSHVDASITAAKGDSKSKKIIIGVLAVVVLLVGAISILGSNESKSDSSQESASVISIKAEELMKDYIRDQGTAETKYKNKEVNVTGKVLSKSQFHNSNNFFMMLATTYVAGKTYNVLVSVPADKVDIINKSDEGKFVSVKGKCIGIVQQDDPTKISVQIEAEKINQ